MLLVKKLRQVHDAFRLRQEMLWMLGTCIACVGKLHMLRVYLFFLWFGALIVWDENTTLVSLADGARASILMNASSMETKACSVLALHAMGVPPQPRQQRSRFSSSQACCKIPEECMLPLKYWHF